MPQKLQKPVQTSAGALGDSWLLPRAEAVACKEKAPALMVLYRKQLDLLLRLLGVMESCNPSLYPVGWDGKTCTDFQLCK